MEIHNGQGLGIYDGGKLTAIISDGGGSQVGMVGSEWLTSISILQKKLKKIKKNVDTYWFLFVRSDVWETIIKGVLWVLILMILKVLLSEVAL